MKHFAFLFLLSGMLLATPALATDQATSSTGSNTTSTTETPSDLSCIKDAIDIRDAGIITALDAYHASAKAAVVKRTTDLKAAWDVTSKASRRAELKDVWSAYRTALRTSNTKLRTDKKIVWNKFRTDRAKCKGIAASDDTGSSSMDTSL